MMIVNDCTGHKYVVIPPPFDKDTVEIILLLILLF